jgi:tRNA A-37 threonylcarbamoyl transferase component Bud32
MRTSELPAGYVRFIVDGAEVVCIDSAVDAIREALRGGSLFEYAGSHVHARTLMGRGVVFAAPLPSSDERVVVRHNRHGGMLARVTRDLFRGETRAPHELRVSERLRERGVPTPAIVSYVVYPVAFGFKRVDVATREIPDSADLSTALMSNDADRRGKAIRATADLVVTLSNAGARHADLNVKNILLRNTDDGSFDAVVLDVDRITFDEHAVPVLELNLARLLRSARKWQTRYGAWVTDAELDGLAALVRERRPPMPLSTSS